MMNPSKAFSLKLITVVLLILISGTFGYYLIEDDWSLNESFYMTIITITTVGFGEIRELSPAGRLFTVVLIITGWTTVAVTLAHFARAIVESGVKGGIAKKKMQRRISKMKDHYIVCGFGRIGGSICEEIDRKGLPFVVIELDKDLVAEADEKNYNVLRADATTDATLKEAGVSAAEGVVATLGADKDNLFITLAARELNPKIFIISRSEETGVEDRILRAGADIVVSPMKLGGQQIAQLIVREKLASSETTISQHVSTALGFALTVFRNEEDGPRTVSEALERSGSLTAVALKHEDGSVELSPLPDKILSPKDSLVLLTRDSLAERESVGRGIYSKKILLADDHKALRLLFARKIGAAGYEIITAADGEEALELAREHQPDLVVLDVMMPEKTGYDVCRTIKEIPEMRDTPVILYSAMESDDFFRKGKESGADVCIRKTNRSSELLNKIDKLLYERPEEVSIDSKILKRAHSPVDSETGVEKSGSIVLDPNQILKTTGRDLELVREILEVFLEDTPRQLKNLEMAFAEENSEHVVHIAHSLKGASASMGFIELRDITAEIEGGARGGKLVESRGRMKILHQAFDRLKAELESIDWDTIG
jgi:voltage-gated potassium channel Kch/CheY-like chemotaxis protein/HPt (histidine-containing phosphotransfer) domain-containing protein